MKYWITLNFSYHQNKQFHIYLLNLTKCIDLCLLLHAKYLFTNRWKYLNLLTIIHEPHEQSAPPSLRAVNKNKQERNLHDTPALKNEHNLFSQITNESREIFFHQRGCQQQWPRSEHILFISPTFHFYNSFFFQLHISLERKIESASFHSRIKNIATYLYS